MTRRPTKLIVTFLKPEEALVAICDSLLTADSGKKKDAAEVVTELEEAKELLRTKRYVDIYKGKVLNIDVTRLKINPLCHDAIYGYGAAARDIRKAEEEMLKGV